MKTIELQGEAKLTKSGRESLQRKLGALRALTRLLRDQPLPRHCCPEDVRAQQSILGELQLCIELGHTVARGECNPETGLARFDFRYGALVRGAFLHLEEIGLGQ